MRLLLISDTHGHLAQVDELAQKTGADAVLHAGDFGFYDDQSVDRLEARELFLRIVHSDLPSDEKNKAKKLQSDKMRDFIRKRLPLSDLGAWLKEGRGFSVPVYAVWGNHEDRVVVEALIAGRLNVPNLHLLHESQCARVGPFQLFGLGGNIVPSRLADSPSPLAGEGGKIWTTLAQIGKLAQCMAIPKEKGEARILISHLSPGKEPLLIHLCALQKVDVTVSGHMGSPWTVVWDEFSVREPSQSHKRLSDAQERLLEVLSLPLPSDPALRPYVQHAISVLNTLPNTFADTRGSVLPRWYRGGFHVNLPDAPDGYAVITYQNGKIGLETVSHGFFQNG